MSNISSTSSVNGSVSTQPLSLQDLRARMQGDPKELQLIEDLELDDTKNSDHELLTAPLLSRAAAIKSGVLDDRTRQYGVLGLIKSIHYEQFTETATERMYVNTTTPFSSLVCGVQGSGKSHTVGVMLENMLIPRDARLGNVTEPMSGMVLHFGESGSGAKPCEAAFVGTSLPNEHLSLPPVTVYVSPSSLNSMKALYGPLGANVKVMSLYFREDELDAKSFLSMMAVGSNDASSTPLYMHTVLSILRKLGEEYSYRAFKRELEYKKQDMNPAQKNGLEQRMALLESFLVRSGVHQPAGSRFSAGRLTIFDLTDPFIDPGAACGLFEIATRLFVRASVGAGKFLLVDEAHKYLGLSGSSSGLTSALLSLIRQQRHFGMRILISTQEPTAIPDKLLDLCSIMMLHRFSSPSWWHHLEKHVSAKFAENEAFDQCVRLRTGEALVLAPSGLRYSGEESALRQLGRNYLIVKVRKRLTQDGGVSQVVLGA